MTRDQKMLWLDKIWEEIHAFMGFDAYFRLWVKAQEAANIPYGPIAQTIMSGYVTYQLAAIRRVCDRRRQDDVISLPKILELLKQEQSYRSAVIDSLLSRLKVETDELYTLATQHVAHNADPQNTRNWRAWSVTSAQLTATHKAICEVAIIIERDLLLLTQRTNLIRVFQSDFLAEVKPYVAEGQLPALRAFWYAHNDSVNKWVHVPRPL